jgi:hypothetical protein
MAPLMDEQLRALRFLARRHGCAEEVLLAQGFTTGQLGWLVSIGLAKLRLGPGGKVPLVKITAAGRKAIANRRRQG